MENYKENIVNVVRNFLHELGNEVPECQPIIEREIDNLMGEINSIATPMDVDTPRTHSPSSPSTSTNTSDSEVRKYITPIFLLF